MNGPQDLGGRAGFGAVLPEADEPPFHDDWERRVLGMTLACGALGHWSIDESRHARESLSPGLYYTSSYYAIWLAALERLLLRHGEITQEEIDDGRMRQAGRAVQRRLEAVDVASTLARGGPTNRCLASPPRYAVGDAVRTIVTHVRGHTRLPGYARDKRGRVERVHEPHVFPDASATGDTSRAEWLYTVVFDGSTLWGDGGDASLDVSIDAWESYLEPA